MKIAVIDIGTNSIHMLMAQIGSHYSFQVLGREKDMVRLGDHTLSQGMLSPATMARGLAVICQFVDLARKKDIPKIFAVATSAVRESKNGGDFVEQIKLKTGIPVRVITGEEEGRLIYWGVKHSQNLPRKQNTLIIDIGGGSVETILANDQSIHFLKSFKMGVVRLKELFHASKNVKAVQKYIEVQLAEAIPELTQHPVAKVIGTSGTLNNIEAMIRLRRPKNKPAVTDRSFNFKEVKALSRMLTASTASQRARLKGLDAKRRDLIAGGALLVMTMMKLLKLERISICDQALREGMIYEFIAKNQNSLKLETQISDIRLRQILALVEKYQMHRIHAEHSAKLALQIFDQTSAWHHLTSKDRDLLYYGAMIHKIGYFINYERYHHHSYYLIKNTPLSSFDPEEIEILAMSARYHRGSYPKKNHADFNLLLGPLKKRILWMAAIIRLAAALDRSYFSVVQSLKVKLRSSFLEFLLYTQNDAQYEVWEAQKKSDLFQKLSRKALRFKVIPVDSAKRSINNGSKNA